MAQRPRLIRCCGFQCGAVQVEGPSAGRLRTLESLRPLRALGLLEPLGHCIAAKQEETVSVVRKPCSRAVGIGGTALYALPWST